MDFQAAFDIVACGRMVVVDMDFDVGSFQKVSEFSNAAGLSGVHQDQLFYAGEIDIIDIHHVE